MWLWFDYSTAELSTFWPELCTGHSTQGLIWKSFELSTWRPSINIFNGLVQGFDRAYSRAQNLKSAACRRNINNRKFYDLKYLKK